MTPSDMREFKETHLKWYANIMRYWLRLRPRWTDTYLVEAQQNSDTEDEYDVMVRSIQGAHREYAPMTDRVTYELNRSIIEGHYEMLRNTLSEDTHHAWVRNPCQH
ncbi:hypothetical protein D1007_61542 [Hordeum vulgare]|nr:hypothetical protein D1007_61542 [Hordeum vulgare]